MTLTVEPKRKPKLLTVDEFMARPGESGMELIDGVPTEKKPMGALSDRVALKIAFLIMLFCDKAKAGHVFGSDTMYRCFGNARTGRKGDASFIRMGRLAGERTPEGSIDVIVEVVSPTDLAYDVEAKANLYLSHGFGELWVVFPNTRTVHVRRPGEPAQILGEADTLTGRDGLHGFACKVSDLFPA